MLSGLAGVSNLPVQQHRKISRIGTNFTLMVVGESGSGKTTLINTLFATSLLGHKRYEESHALDRTVKVEVVRVEVEEKGFVLKLTLIDTPGYGDYVNNNNCWGPIMDFIDSRHDDYLNNETSSKSEAKEDLRVHACLYFIQPTGRTLKNIDIKMMGELSTRVNLIPVIAKADTITPAELTAFKERIRQSLQYYKINYYVPSILNDDNDSVNELQKTTSAMPFAVVGSEDLYEINGKLCCGRKYIWGIVQVENEAHCDFVKLKNLLMKTHMYDLIYQTENVHYENYRTNVLKGYGRDDEETEEIAARNLDAVIKQEIEIKEQFKEKVKVEESRFLGWEETLRAKRDELNADLEKRYKRVKQLEEETKKHVVLPKKS